jgi:hypothetical protein
MSDDGYREQLYDALTAALEALGDVSQVFEDELMSGGDYPPLDADFEELPRREVRRLARNATSAFNNTREIMRVSFGDAGDFED